jgi:uncharacterized Zn-finger protein
MKTHEDERELIACTWPGCHRTFLFAKNRDVHVKSAHVKEKPYRCDVAGCGAEFAHKHLLSRHKRLHEEGEKVTRNHLNLTA